MPRVEVAISIDSALFPALVRTLEGTYRRLRHVVPLPRKSPASGSQKLRLSPFCIMICLDSLEKEIYHASQVVLAFRLCYCSEYPCGES